VPSGPRREPSIGAAVRWRADGYRRLRREGPAAQGISICRAPLRCSVGGQATAAHHFAEGSGTTALPGSCWSLLQSDRSTLSLVAQSEADAARIRPTARLRGGGSTPAESERGLWLCRDSLMYGLKAATVLRRGESEPASAPSGLCECSAAAAALPVALATLLLDLSTFLLRQLGKQGGCRLWAEPVLVRFEEPAHPRISCRKDLAQGLQGLQAAAAGAAASAAAMGTGIAASEAVGSMLLQAMAVQKFMLSGPPADSWLPVIRDHLPTLVAVLRLAEGWLADAAVAATRTVWQPRNFHPVQQLMWAARRQQFKRRQLHRCCALLEFTAVCEHAQGLAAHADAC